jgi:hypothetical protein
MSFEESNHPSDRIIGHHSQGRDIGENPADCPLSPTPYLRIERTRLRERGVSLA